MTFEQWLIDGKKNNFFDLYESMKEEKERKNVEDTDSARKMSRYLGKKLLPMKGV